MIIYDPTRRFSIKPETLEAEPEKKPTKAQKIWRSICNFFESDFVFYTTIAILRIIQVSLIVLWVYFMTGGKL